MSTIILHIGTPRTGTTVLQKHLFPKSNQAFIVSKRAYESSGNLRNDKKPLMGYTTKEEMITSLQNNSAGLTNITEHFIKNIITPLVQISRNNRDVEVERLICVAVKQLLKIKSNTNLVLSSERICDCSASLVGDSRHTRIDEEFLV